MGGNTSGASSSRTVDAFLAIAQLLPDPLVLLTQPGRIRAANDAFVRLLARGSEPVVGRSLLDACGDGADALAEFLHLCSATGSPLPGACTLVSAGRPSRWRMSGAAFRPRDGGPPLVVIRLMPSQTATPFTRLNRQIADLNREIARRLSVERALRDRQDQLQRLLEEREEWLARERQARFAAEAANRLKDEFLAVLSHELRTPLNAVVGWAGMLEAGTLDPERAAQAVQVISRNAKLQWKVVEDLLDVSRISTGRLRLEPAPIDLGSIVRDVVESVRPAAENKAVELTSELPPHPTIVNADETRLQQVVWNLLTNAVKFTPPGGRVVVAVARTADTARLTVTDTGQGFPPEFRSALFQPFRQADASSTRTHGGLGLGLVLVRQLVEAHGGEVDAESRGPGTGASFTVTLPVRDHGQSPRRD